MKTCTGIAGVPDSRSRSGGIQEESRKKDSPPKIRKEFPETWLWADEKLE